jgi:hypothetical protein
MSHESRTSIARGTEQKKSETISMHGPATLTDAQPNRADPTGLAENYAKAKQPFPRQKLVTIQV